MNAQKKLKNDSYPFQYLDFSKASPEAVNSILEALNAEVKEAIGESRFPSMDRALQRLCPTVAVSVAM